LAGIRIIITQVTNTASAGWAIPVAFRNGLQKQNATEISFLKQVQIGRTCGEIRTEETQQ
jgi:hypothetical protein